MTLKIHFRFTFCKLIFLFLIFTSLLMCVRILHPDSSILLMNVLNAERDTQAIHFEEFAVWDRWDNVSGFPTVIVPNIVHFIKLQKHELSFVEHIVILAAWCNQRPDKIIIHCDCNDLSGMYWAKVKDLRGIEVRRISRPTKVFGKALSEIYNVFHAGDIARIQVLKQYGGIALDFDTYIIRTLDEFRRFECTVAWPEGANIGCQLIISHMKSRFLQLYWDSYHAYRSSSWYYNAGQLPTRILELMPHIVHRVPWKLGVHDLVRELYKSQWPGWRSYYAVHLLIRHRGKSAIEFDEYNIRNYSYTFGEMARLILFGSTDLIPHNNTISWEYLQCRQ